MNDRIRMAFVQPSALTPEDLTELIAAMRRDATKRNSNCRRLFRIGESYALGELPKRDQRKPRLPKWARRELSNDDLDRLKSAWATE